MDDMQYTSSLTGLVYDVEPFDDDHFCISTEGVVISIVSIDDDFTEIVEDHERRHMG